MFPNRMRGRARNPKAKTHKRCRTAFLDLQDRIVHPLQIFFVCGPRKMSGRVDGKLYIFTSLSCEFWSLVFVRPGDNCCETFTGCLLETTSPMAILAADAMIALTCVIAVIVFRTTKGAEDNHKCCIRWAVSNMCCISCCLFSCDSQNAKKDMLAVWERDVAFVDFHSSLW